MQNEKAKGEYRNLTPQEIGDAVVRFRQMMGWKQFRLAYEAGVSERTLQRIEVGKKVDDESLRKIGRALKLRDPGFLGPRYIQSDEEMQATLGKMLRETMLIEAHNLSTIKDCEAILGGDGYFLMDDALPEEMADQVATLRDQMQDSGDIWSDLSYTEKLETCRTFLTEVQRIEEQGFKTRYGAYESDDHFRVSVLMFGRGNEEGFAKLDQFVVPRKFAKLALEGLRNRC